MAVAEPQVRMALTRSSGLYRPPLAVVAVAVTEAMGSPAVRVVEAVGGVQALTREAPELLGKATKGAATWALAAAAAAVRVVLVGVTALRLVLEEPGRIALRLRPLDSILAVAAAVHTIKAQAVWAALAAVVVVVVARVRLGRRILAVVVAAETLKVPRVGLAWSW